MGYTVWIEQLPREFWLSGLFGTFVTVLFAVNAFAQPTFERVADKPETSFSPSELTSASDYLISFCLYLAGLLGFYWLVCLIGPAPFLNAGLAGDADADRLAVPGAFPLYVAMLLVGVLPRLPMVSYFEQSWRKLMHARARIPQAVLVRSSDLRRAEYRFDSFALLVQRRDGMFARNVTPADLADAPTGTSHRWARLSAILQQLTTLDTQRDAARYVDPDFLDRHRTILSAITADYFSLAEKIARERGHVHTSPAARLGLVAAAGSTENSGSVATTVAAGTMPAIPVADDHAEAIERLLRRVCMLLACAMLTTPESLRNPDSAMRAFGFSTVPTSDVVNEIDIVVKAMVVSLLAYCLFVFIAFRITGALPVWMSATGWPSPGLGNDRLQFIVTFILPQLASITGALMLRHTFRRKRNWFRYRTSQPSLPSSRNYIGIVALSFVLALLTSSYLAGTWQGADKIVDDLYWRFFEGFVPAASALFVCLAIDAAIIDGRVSQRRWIALAHPVVACAIALGAADHFYTNDKGLDFTGAVLYSAVGTLVFAGTLAVAVLLLATRDTLVHEIDGLRDSDPDRS